MNALLRKIQIGVIGSAKDLGYSKRIEGLAEKIGYLVARKRVVLLFGAEKDGDSLSSAACRGAKQASGFTVGVTYGKGLGVSENSADVVIATGLERGGGREFTLILSCDAVIALAGGSGTLNEIAVAYQNRIPVVVLKNTGGWSERLAHQFLDARKRIRIKLANSPEEAVNTALRPGQQKRKLNGNSKNSMDKLIIFDFNRTLYDPDQTTLVPGALRVLKALKQKGFKLALLAQARANRKKLLKVLEMDQYFDRLTLVEKKTVSGLKKLAGEMDVDLKNCTIVGDRVKKEIRIGNRLGMKTVWLKRGKFSTERPSNPAERPDLTIKKLFELPALLK
ncbi:MAG: HAD hydrolase-like protein [Candidatus Doudnabacteria bacterium]|nr:HAD hydrolase-like protein [Candidatus Doudnabacteria bacterium]